MNDNSYIETEYLRDEIAKCEDVTELAKRIFPMLKTQQSAWEKKIDQIINENGYSKSAFAKLTGVSRVSVDKWCKGSIPKNRETFIRIGMAANYSLEEMNQFLMRYGQYPALYSKSLEDCICIYVLNNYHGEEIITKYEYILNKIKDKIIKKVDYREEENIETRYFDEKLSNINADDELEAFVNENIKTFALAYHKFYAYVKANIYANYNGYSDTIFEMAQIQGWSSSLRQCVSAIRQNKWYPTRNKIISLGLHLSMDHEQIDEMLELAHMEPLCAKNIFESVIIFILEDASLNDILNRESDEYDPDELCVYAREVLEEIDLPEIDVFISELPEADEEW